MLPPGAFLLVKGRHKIHISIVLSNSISLQFFFMFLMYSIFLYNNRTAWIDWVNLVAWMLLGGAASLFLARFRLKYSIFMQAVFAGCVAAMLLMTAA